MKVKVAQSPRTLSTRLSRPEYWRRPRPPALQADSSPAEPPGKPKNTAVGGLSLLQQIFPTQESNWGSPALQVDSLPAELPGKPFTYLQTAGKVEIDKR